MRHHIGCAEMYLWVVGTFIVLGLIGGAIGIQ